MDEGMYRENIMDHFKRPRNLGSMSRPTVCNGGENVLCGDRVGFCLKIKKGKIEDVKFEGKACAICTASASMLTDEMKGKEIEWARKYDKEKLLSLLGVELGPTRLKCALLPLKVIKLAIYKHLGKKAAKEDEELA
jgi:nitrogen fixation NifU-like protein